MQRFEVKLHLNNAKVTGNVENNIQYDDTAVHFDSSIIM